MSCCNEGQTRAAGHACCSAPNAIIKPDDVSKAAGILKWALAIGLVGVALLVLVDLVA